MSKKLLNTCLDFIQTYGFDSSVFYEYFLSVKSDLLSDDKIAKTLILGISKEGKSEETRFSDLFTRLLDEARMDVENDGLYGKTFLESSEVALKSLQAKKSFEYHTHMNLVECYGRASLKVPEVLIFDLNSDFDTPEFPTPLPADLEQMLTSLQEEGGTSYDFYLALNNASSAFPSDAQAGFARYVSTMENPAFERLALYWLLDRTPLIRESAAMGLADNAALAKLHPETLQYMPMLRSWMGSGRARNIIDNALKNARRKEISGAIENQVAIQIHERRASVVDGVGSQSLSILAQNGQNVTVSMLLTKMGHGIKDAFVIPCDSLKEAHGILEKVSSHSPGFLIDQQTLELILQSALADGLEHKALPAPGLLDVVEQCGLFSLKPQATSVQAWMEYVDPQGEISDASPQKRGRLVNGEDTWHRLFPLTDCWFEDNETTRAIVSSTGSERTIETKLWKYLETRREIWAQRMLQTAAMLKDDQQNPDWKCLAAAAFQLINQKALRKIPVMREILYTTIDAAEEKLLQQPRSTLLYHDDDSPELYSPLGDALVNNLSFITDGEYSDQDASTISDWFDVAFDEFEKDLLFEELNDCEKQNGYFMISCFYDFCYGYHLAGPADIDEYIIDDVCLDIMPRKVSASAEMFATFAPTITRFFTWSEQQGFLSKTKALQKHIAKISPKMIKKSEDPGNWGMAKSMVFGNSPDGELTEGDLLEHLTNMIPHDPDLFAEDTIPLERTSPKVGRNDPCPCGSGKKYKKCCLN
ncbi:YecA family protein [Kiloniella sp.]|uniref:YecA family protein n=1 Tax=Kiloniella sp. TaxID=1938587 RepID=UPI003B02AD64